MGTETLSAQHFIDSLEFAKQSLEIHDKIRASNLPGLKDVLSSGDGELEYRIVGGRLGRDKLTLRIEVQGVLDVVCQRCLGDMKYEVAVARTFMLVADESALPDEEFEDDEVDYLVADAKLCVESLVEEEILLSLPYSLRHEGGCTDDIPSASIGKPNPFQVLEGLKKQ